MPITKLPQSNINYPVVRYPSIPPRPVIPTALLVENLMRQLQELTPAERERKKLELSLLQQSVMGRDLDTKIKGIELQHAQQAQDLFETNVKNVKARMDIAFGDGTLPESQPASNFDLLKFVKENNPRPDLHHTPPALLDPTLPWNSETLDPNLPRSADRMAPVTPDAMTGAGEGPMSDIQREKSINPGRDLPDLRHSEDDFNFSDQLVPSGGPS